MNNCTFAGRLGDTPEFKFIENGNSVANFSLAVYISKDKTLWVKCAAWGKNSETVNSFCTKGTFVVVSGPADFEVYTKKNGDVGGNIKLTVNSLTLGPKTDDIPF